MMFTSQTNVDHKLVYPDAKRRLWILSVLVPSMPTVAVFWISVSAIPVFAILPLMFYFGIVPLLDWLIGEDPNNPPEEAIEQLSADPWYRLLLFMAIPVFWASFVTSIWAVASLNMPMWANLVLIVGAGVASGAGLTVGHELGHKQNFWDQLGAKLVNAVTGYGHFCIEHNRGHHLMVATPEDPASARLGESVYRFVLRELPGTAIRGWQMEQERLGKKGLGFWSARNDILQGYLITLTIALCLVYSFGLYVLPFILLHHFVGWLQLTLANYVEHYGLLRLKRDNGRYEPCQPHHSWNTNHIVSNLMLFHLQRHSDHHANPLRPYQSLRNFDDLPRLPSGYPGTYLLALIPPLWFSVMDKKVLAWAGGDASKTNLDPKNAGYYLNAS